MTKESRATSPQQPLASGSGIRPNAALSGIPKVEYADDGLIAAEVGPLCVAIWRVQPADFLFERQASTLATVAARQPGKFGFLCIVEEKTPAPDQKIRQASVSMLAAFETRLACVACVIPDRGFTSAITRSVLSGMSLLFGPRAFPIKIADEVESAVLWMGGHVQMHYPKLLTATIEDLRNLTARPDATER